VAKLFPARLVVFCDTGPRALSSSGSSSHVLVSSSEYVTATTCPMQASCSSHEVSLPIATSTCRVHSLTGHPTRSMFRPQCFSHSRRFTPRLALRAYFIPLPRPGFPLQGLSLLPSQCNSSLHCPLLPLTTFASDRVAPTVQLRPPQLQGFNPGNSPLRHAGGLTLLATRSPLEFSTPAGFSPNVLASPSLGLRS